LHSSAQTQNQMKCRLLLDIVVGQCATIFQLLSSEDLKNSEFFGSFHKFSPKWLTKRC
jgi:hypothetical protein